jgi:excisionase family DNA binding protein
MVMAFSLKDAAHQCGLSERTLHTAVKSGALEVLRVGRRVLITPPALERFLRANKSEVRNG